MSVNSEYLEAVVKYLSVLEEQEMEKIVLNGKETYLFSCPFCSKYVQTDQAKQNKTGHLVRVQDNQLGVLLP